MSISEDLVKATFRKFCKGIQWGRNGQNKALCPLHDDTRQSFSFNNEGLWKCFGCQKQGNIKQFANIMGIDSSGMIPNGYANSKPKPKVEPPKIDTIMLKIKAEEYHKKFRMRFIGATPTEEVLNDWQKEHSFMVHNLVGIDHEGRLTFPYFNNDMQVIAIKHHKQHKEDKAPYWHKGGDNKPKWYNGWNLALYKPSKRLIIAEGEPDTVHLSKLGFQVVCSSHGTTTVPELIPRMKEWL